MLGTCEMQVLVYQPKSFFKDEIQSKKTFTIFSFKLEYGKQQIEHTIRRIC
jgi:hypothetical protein